jgi:cellulose synthase (UDP-forming)
MFFCWSQPGHHSMGSAFCVGTNVAYRRAALDAAGGFPKISGGEDIITSVEFLAAGFRTIYVPLSLARGLCPDTFASVVNQQYRWCLTTLAMVFPVRGIERVCGSFWHCPMPLRQRFVFMAGLLYYGQSLLVLVITVMPSLIMLWCYPYQLGPGNYLPILPSMLGLALLPLMIPGWRLEMMRLSLIYAVAHLIAIADALAGRVVPWVPSGADGHRAKTSLQAAVIVRSWVVITQGLAWIAIARDLPTYGLPAYWPAILLTSVQTVIFAPLLLPGYGTVPVSQMIRMGHRRTPRPPVTRVPLSELLEA